MAIQAAGYARTMHEVRENYGAFLVTRRSARRWTQKQLADAVGVDRLAVSQWENNRNRPSAENAKKLASIFPGTEPEDFGYVAAAPGPGPAALPEGSWTALTQRLDERDHDLQETLAEITAKLDELLRYERQRRGLPA